MSMTRQFLFGVLFGGVTLLVTACNPMTATPGLAVPRLPLVTPEVSLQAPASSQRVPQFITATPLDSGETYRPLPDAACQALQKSAEQILKISFTQSEAPFTDAVTGETGSACTLTAQGSGDKFAGRGASEIQDAIKTTLVGWTYSPAYQADGPVGEARGYARDQALLLVIVEWLPAPDANCSPDQPMSECTLKPEQKLYTITLQAAQK